ncbi:MAG: hypothetical protein QM820_19575 [Minicystis sp.]
MSIRVVIPAPRDAAGVGASLGSITAQREGAEEAVVVEGAADADPSALIEDGFARAGGDVLAWLPPGDTHFAWTLRAAADIFASFPEVAWIASLRPATVDATGICDSVGALPGFARDAFLDGRISPAAIHAPATFFRRSLWERAGGRFPERGPAAAFSLWARFFEHADLVGVDVPLAVALAYPPDPARRRAEDRVLADLRAGSGYRPSLLRAATTRLALAQLPRIGEAIEGAFGYAGRRLLRPDRGPGRFHLEHHTFS